MNTGISEYVNTGKQKNMKLWTQETNVVWMTDFFIFCNVVIFLIYCRCIMNMISMISIVNMVTFFKIIIELCFYRYFEINPVDKVLINRKEPQYNVLGKCSII